MGTRGRILRAAAILVLVVGVAACGDDDSSDDESSSEDTSTDVGTSEGDNAADDSGDNDDSGDDGGGGSGEAGASVTIDGETYEANNQVVCVTMGGALGASFADDSGEVTIDVDMPPPDWESDSQSDWSPPRVRVDDDRTDPIKQWISGTDEFDPDGAESEVSSYTIEGNHTEGTGTFVDVYGALSGEGDNAEGTFEVTCE